MEIIDIVPVQVEDVEGLDTLGKIVVETDTGTYTVYSGKEQWADESYGIIFYPGDRLSPSFIKHLGMEGCFGGDNHDTIEPKTFRGFVSEAFLVPLEVYASYDEGEVYA